jgi:hypothetical protein
MMMPRIAEVRRLPAPSALAQRQLCSNLDIPARRLEGGFLTRSRLSANLVLLAQTVFADFAPTDHLRRSGYQNTANVALGSDDWKTVFFCTRTSLGSFGVKIPGVPVPAVKKS